MISIELTGRFTFDFAGDHDEVQKYLRGRR